MHDRKLRISALALLGVIVLSGCVGPQYPALQAGSGDPGLNAPGAEPIEIAKSHFRQQNFGLAEQTFRSIVEREPRNAEAWLGLAASYDRLRRFKLADRAYEQVGTLAGESAVLHNNRGYSHLLRGDLPKARKSFLKARSLDPDNEYVRNNLKLAERRS